MFQKNGDSSLKKNRKKCEHTTHQLISMNNTSGRHPKALMCKGMWVENLFLGDVQTLKIG
jgi:hypothetical protein